MLLTTIELRNDNDEAQLWEEKKKKEMTSEINKGQVMGLFNINIFPFHIVENSFLLAFLIYAIVSFCLFFFIHSKPILSFCFTYHRERRILF